MIDTHCHILPGIDDGARTLEQAVELARYAVENGITEAICTPHIQQGVYDNTKQTIGAAYTSLTLALEAEAIPLKLHMGAEVRISGELMVQVAQHSIPFLGQWDGFDVMLLELPHNHVPVGSDKLVRWLISRNIRPIIAHPERNKEMMTDLGKLYPFVVEGALLQVTAASLAGQFGKGPQLAGVEMLEREWVNFIASDAHNLDYRPPDLEQGRKVAERFLGAEKALALVYANPMKMLGRA